MMLCMVNDKLTIHVIYMLKRKMVQTWSNLKFIVVPFVPFSLYADIFKVEGNFNYISPFFYAQLLRWFFVVILATASYI